MLIEHLAVCSKEQLLLFINLAISDNLTAQSQKFIFKILYTIFWGAEDVKLSSYTKGLHSTVHMHAYMLTAGTIYTTQRKCWELSEWSSELTTNSGRKRSYHLFHAVHRANTAFFVGWAAKTFPAAIKGRQNWGGTRSVQNIRSKFRAVQVAADYNSWVCACWNTSWHPGILK